jgi:hypothetical protein
MYSNYMTRRADSNVFSASLRMPNRVLQQTFRFTSTECPSWSATVFGSTSSSRMRDEWERLITWKFTHSRPTAFTLGAMQRRHVLSLESGVFRVSEGTAPGLATDLRTVPRDEKEGRYEVRREHHGLDHEGNTAASAAPFPY